LTKTATSSSHTFYGPDDIWNKYRKLCLFKLGKPASRRIEELIEEDLRKIEGAPEPDKTLENIAALQTKLADLEAEYERLRRILLKNYKDAHQSISNFFGEDGSYTLFAPETGRSRIVNGRRQLERFIRDNPTARRKDIPQEAVQLDIRIVEIRIERQEISDKLRVLQCQKYELPRPGSEEEKRMQMERAEQKKRDKEDEAEIDRRMLLLEGDADRRELAEAVANAEYPTCPRCGAEPTEATSNGLPEVQCSSFHVWNLEEGCENDEEDG
jgi:hypothetical protein